MRFNRLKNALLAHKQAFGEQALPFRHQKAGMCGGISWNARIYYYLKIFGTFSIFLCFAHKKGKCAFYMGQMIIFPNILCCSRGSPSQFFCSRTRR